jgi:carbamoyltransferase
MAMIVLGISDNHGSGAALVRDGKLVAAVNQERIDREKNSMAFPAQAIDEVLGIGRIEPEDVDLIVVGSEFTPVFLLRLIKGFHQSIKKKTSQFSILYDLYVTWHILVRFVSLLRSVEIQATRWLYERWFKKRGFLCDISLLDHHRAHAFSAYLTAPFDKATVITADAMGDGVSVSVGIGENGRIANVFEQDGRCAFNPYYTRITEFLGYTPNRHEGKITGLAGYGDPEFLIKDFRKQAHFQAPGFNNYSFWQARMPWRGFYRELKGCNPVDIAAGCQRNLEEQVCEFVRYWVKQTGVCDIALAGGIFENVKLNQRIHELPEVHAIYIFPNMSDGGLASGAALAYGRRKPEALETPFLGMEYSRSRLEKTAEQSGLEISRPTNMAKAIARLIADSVVVARFDGRMEYGPRALGHRSILFRPDDPDVNDWLNEKLRRTEFMPFAPVVRVERAEECFENTHGALFTSRFMNICFDCTPMMKEKCPGVVHVDGTARPQIISRNDDETYYDILSEFEKMTGLPALLNTSFNMHEEPIVATPEDAVRAFKASGLPVLSMGHIFLRNEGSAS